MWHNGGSRDQLIEKEEKSGFVTQLLYPINNPNMYRINK